MQAPTQNSRSQGQHGQFKAIDYNPYPDPTIYAPEDARVSAYYPNAGDAGNNLQLTAGNRVHGFCHLEKTLVSVGQYVKKGQPVGIMGYTGKTDPVGPQGRHLHAVLQIDGTYVYPEPYYTEPFKKQGDTEVIIGSEDNWRWRMNRLHHQIVGNWDMGDDTWNAIKGQEVWKVIESWSDHPGANTALEFQVLGETARNENWSGKVTQLNQQVSDLGKQVAELQERPTKASLDELQAKYDDLQKQSQAVAECVTNEPAQPAKTVPDTFGIWTKLLAHLPFLKAK